MGCYLEKCKHRYAGEVKSSLIEDWDDLKNLKILYHMVGNSVESHDGEDRPENTHVVYSEWVDNSIHENDMNKFKNYPVSEYFKGTRGI